MKRVLFGIAVIVLTAAAVAAYTLPFYPQYWISGTAQDATDGITVDGRYVAFYATEPDAKAGAYSYDLVKPSKQFLLNTFSMRLSALTVKGDYFVAIPNDNPSDPANGYGADAVAVNISGTGLDTLSAPLVLGKGRGPLIIISTNEGFSPSLEPPPVIKLWFDKRLYQQLKDPTTGDMMPFIVAERPNVRVEVTIADNYFLDKVESAGAYSVTVDPGSSYPALDVMAGSTAGRTVMAAGPGDSGKITGQSLEFNLPEPLSSEGDGKHLFVVKARSSGTVGGLATNVTAFATVEVLGGPVRIVGKPITYPSPFSISKQGTVTIQYQLSKKADIEIVFADISGRITKTFFFLSGQEGGNAGVNKVTWDGRTERGTLAGNGIYLGTIVSREDGRKLGTVKLPVVD
jgi:hypothetical protein